tara:strand:- start:86 stop:916 length:831 start_codon:yes stop_codon:yes gene_type:complete
MSKSSQELVKHKIKNPIYSEILIKLNTREVFLFDFVKEFNKARPTLLKQIQELEEEGFIKRKTLKNKNKQIFFINWSKIVKEFWDYCKTIRSDKQIKKEYYTNPYLIYYFQELFGAYNTNKVFNTLENLFRNTTFSLLNSFIIKGTKEGKQFYQLCNFLNNFHYTDYLYDNILERLGERVNNKIEEDTGYRKKRLIKIKDYINKGKLNVFQEGNIFQELKDNYGYTTGEIAKEFSLNEKYVKDIIGGLLIEKGMHKIFDSIKGLAQPVKPQQNKKG